MLAYAENTNESITFYYDHAECTRPVVVEVGDVHNCIGFAYIATLAPPSCLPSQSHKPAWNLPNNNPAAAIQFAESRHGSNNKRKYSSASPVRSHSVQDAPVLPNSFDVVEVDDLSLNDDHLNHSAKLIDAANKPSYPDSQINSSNTSIDQEKNQKSTPNSFRFDLVDDLNGEDEEVACTPPSKPICRLFGDN